MPDLSAFPRVPLVHGPTPLQDAPRLSERLGVTVLIKRDDLTATGVGGNKVRKLEFLLGKAMAEGVDTVVTFGAVQTNHGRQTAAACARLGLRCELVLTAMVPRDGDAYERSGNVLLDRVFGARIHVCPDGESTGATSQRLIEEARSEGRSVATFPLGGSDGLGALGYVAAARELTEQLAERGVEALRLVVPCSSGGTAAGLALGTGLAGWHGRIDVACVSHSAEQTAREVQRLIGESAALLGVSPPAADHVPFDDVTLGEGYGIPDERVWRAIELFGSAEGIALDPVYSGKAAAALVEWVEAGRIARGERVVFLHTGGLPGLFAYAPEFPARRRE